MLSKNVEIEQLIKQVMSGGTEPPKEDETGKQLGAAASLLG